MTTVGRSLRFATVALACLAIGTVTACQPTALNDWIRARGKPTLAEPELSRFVAFVTAIENEQARRDRFVGNIAPVDETRLGLSWRPGCPVAPADLRLLTLSYWGFDGTEKQGELVIHRDVAVKVVAAFRTMWNEKFPINRMETADRFARPSDFAPGGEYIEKPPQPDTINDTYGFFCRRSTGGKSFSQHAYGQALDINPVQNPYVKATKVIPSNGSTVRSTPELGKLSIGSVPVVALRRAGFVWGGSWRSPKDYMHFSTSGR